MEFNERVHAYIAAKYYVHLTEHFGERGKKAFLHADVYKRQEYQCNGAMAAAKEYHKAPIMIANGVVEQLAGSEVFGEVQAVNPGFINMKINDAFLSSYLNGMEADERLGFEKAEHPKTIVIDYGGPNVAKPLHVGHLRSAIIGESVKRIARFAGHHVIGDVHLLSLIHISSIIFFPLMPTWEPSFNIRKSSDSVDSFVDFD